MSDPADLTPSKREPLAWADAAKWKPACSGNGKVTVTNPAPGTLRLDVRFTGTGDRWAYPDLTFDAPQDLSGYDGIAFNLKTSVSDGSSIDMMLVEREGDARPHYVFGTHPSGDTRRVVLLFRDAGWLSILDADPNHHLDLGKIIAVKLGCNTVRDDLPFEVSGLELVRFK